jgi:hypothetical protein
MLKASIIVSFSLSLSLSLSIYIYIIILHAYWYCYLSLLLFHIAFSTSLLSHVFTYAPRRRLAFVSLSNYRIQGDWLRLPSFGLFTEIGVVLPLVLALLEAAASLVVLLLLGRGGGVRC